MPDIRKPITFELSVMEAHTVLMAIALLYSIVKEQGTNNLANTSVLCSDAINKLGNEIGEVIEEVYPNWQELFTH